MTRVLSRTILLFLLWIELSLLAIAFIGERPYLGLAIAIVGGIILGAMSLIYYEPELPAGEHERALKPDQENAMNEESVK